MNIEAIDPASYEAAIPGLGALLKDAVDGGASVNFVAGVSQEQTEGWWRARAERVADGTITVFVARDDSGRIVGSTLLERSVNPNSPHRAEIGKVIVHRSLRRRGAAGEQGHGGLVGTLGQPGRHVLFLGAADLADQQHRARGGVSLEQRHHLAEP